MKKMFRKTRASFSLLYSLLATTIMIILCFFYIVFGTIILIVIGWKFIVSIEDKKKNSKINETIDDIDLMDGYEFEEFIAFSILPKLGYKKINKTKNSVDYGVDITAELNGEKIAFQCKRFQGKVGNDSVQEVSAGLNYYHCSKGVVISNNYFTKNAIILANANNITLLDRDNLKQMISQIIENDNRKIEEERNKFHKERYLNKIDSIKEQNILKVWLKRFLRFSVNIIEKLVFFLKRNPLKITYILFVITAIILLVLRINNN